jgi:hypothetical protein
VKQAKATLAKLDGTTSKGIGSSKKPSKKHKKASGTASQPDPDLKVEYQSDLEQAKEAAEKAKVKVELSAQEMFQLYANFLSIDAKYAWNKIAHKQTQSDPYTDLQAISRKGPRGYLHKSFNDWVKFHLLAMFLNNAAEQERYYITTCSRNPSVSACVSLCSVWSSSTPTLRNYHADSTVPVPSLVRFLQMCHLPRLMWQVMFFGCAYLRGRTISIFTRKV